MRTTSLPFQLDRDETQGHAVPAPEIHGIVRVEPDAIVVHFGTGAAAFDIDDTGGYGLTDSVRIAMADLVRVDLTGGAIKSPRLVLEVAREDVLKPVPWADGRLCVVRFRRADAVHAQELLTEIEVRMAEVQARREESGDS